MQVYRAIRSILCAAVVCVCAPAWSQFQPAPVSATTIPAAAQMQAAELNALLKADAGQKPLVLQVGGRVFFDQAHIVGSVYAGPGSRPAGIQLLESTVAREPKDRFIVLYCGCCPWGRCPNVGPAFLRLHELGFTRVKVLYLANNFGDDWVNKGYLTEHK